MIAKSLLKTSRVLHAAIALLASAGLSFAATLTWDADGVAPLGGTGTWNTVNSAWTTSGTYQAWNNVSNDDAVFNTTAGTVTLAEAITANSLTFDITGYTVAGGGFPLTVTSGNVTVTTGSANFNAQISGTNGFTKLGAGILTVGGTASSYTGNTLVSNGVLAVGVTNAFNTAGSLTVNSGATFRMSGSSANQQFTGLVGSGTVQWTIGATGNPRLTLNVASGTSTFAGVFSSTQAGNQRVATITKSGGGTQVFSNGAGFGFDRGLLTLTGGTLQLSANNQFGYVQITGAGGTLELNGNNQSIDTWAANSTVTNSNLVTTSTLSSAFNGKDWSGNITGNIRIQAGGAHDTNLRGTNSFTGGVNLNQGAFTITSAAQLPANQIDLAGGNLDFSASGITLASDRTFTVGAGNSSLRYRVSTAGTATLQGAINDAASPGTLNFVTHPSNNGDSTFILSGSGNFSGTTRIGGSSSTANTTLRSGAMNGISTNTILDFGGGTSRTYSYDLNGFSQQVAGLTNSGSGAGLVQRVINTGTASTFTVSSSTNTTFSGRLGDTGGNNFGLTKSGAGSLTLSGSNTYIGATQINLGTLVIAAGGSLSASSAVAVNNGGTLAGLGTVNGTVTVNSGGILSPGNSPGLQNMGSLVLNDGGNYNWQILDATGVVGVGFDTINLTGSLDLTGLTGATDYNINLWSLSSIGPDVDGNAANFNNANNQTWTLVTTGNVITGFDASEFTVNFLANAGAGGFSNALLPGGAFTVALSGDSTDLVLNFTAVPEPSTMALVTISLTAAMIFRRRRAFDKA